MEKKEIIQTFFMKKKEKMFVNVNNVLIEITIVVVILWCTFENIAPFRICSV